MSTTNTDTPAVDTAPLLDDHQNGAVSRTSSGFLPRAPSLRGAARFLSRASSRTGSMREPSVRVREAAAQQIEERQSDWAYSKPIVILDLIWNLAFIIASIVVMIVSRNETPSMPLRLWIVGYVMQCILHMVCVYVEYKKRHSRGNFEQNERSQIRYGRSYSSVSSGSDGVEAGDHVTDVQQINDHETSVAKHLESANTMFSFIWWIIGFYWVSAGGENLTNESPLLYWLSITFLAFDVFFVVICVALACVIGIAVCCCLPCIIAILYAVAEQEGASEEVIKKLPRFKFQRIGDLDKQNGEIQESGGVMTECDTDSPIEHVLTLEDAECCICLCPYEDGAELRELHCRHHFHSGCIDKWLHINATCPLCKLNILKCSGESGREEA